MKSRNIYPICVSLSEKNAQGTITLGRKFPFVEVRLDAGSYNSSEVSHVFKNLKNSIATCRPGRYDDKTRMEYLICALNAGAKFVDVEFESAVKFKKPLVDLAKKRKARSIISFHDYFKTPSKAKLTAIIKQAKRQGADIVKIATQVRNHSDLKSLLGLLSDNEKLVVIGMGEAGKAIRIASPMLGGLFTFAAPEIGKETAAGQMDFKTLKDMYSALGLI